MAIELANPEIVANDRQLDSLAQVINIEHEQCELMSNVIVFLTPKKIVSKVEIRSIKPNGVERLKDKIKKLGFQIDHPIRVYPVENGYRLISGNHRLQAAIEEKIESIPAIVVEPPANELDAIKQARECNEASETLVPSNFVDDAELIWRMLDEKDEDGKPKYKQQDVANALGWKTQVQIAQYKALQKICKNAWDVVITSFDKAVIDDENDAVIENITTVIKSDFSERILRNILDLKPGQQLELCRKLAKGKNGKGNTFGKKEFKSEAENYRVFNYLKSRVITELLKVIPTKDAAVYLKKAFSAIKTNKEYVNEWLTKSLKSTSEEEFKKTKFCKLIQALIDEWQKQASILIICKDIRGLTADDIATESIDCIITDPPYPENYIELFDTLGELAARVLKPGGSLIAMTGQLYLPQYIDNLSKHLTYHWALAYTTPGGQAAQIWNKEVNTFWKPLLWFVKGDRDGRWVSDVINTPVNANDKQHHHWGQSVNGMTAIVEKFSIPGDVVLDPFLGGGTTGYVCKTLNRKFIGVEIDEQVASEAKERIYGKH